MGKKFRKESFASFGVNATVALAIVFLPSLVGSKYITSWYLNQFQQLFFGPLTGCLLVVGLLASAVARRMMPSLSSSHTHDSFGATIQHIRRAHKQEQELRKQQTLECIKEYTVRTMTPYMTNESLYNLIHNIELWDQCRPCRLVPVITRPDLRTVDMFHFAWNIGARLDWSGLDSALFLKNSFEQLMINREVDTIRRNLRIKKECVIPLDPPEKDSPVFHNEPVI